MALCALFQPVAPAKMAELAERLGVDHVPILDEARTIAMSGRVVEKGSPLFPRIQPSWASEGS